MRSNFGSSRLVALLDAWTPLDGAASGMDFAERLSLWLNAFDAIELQAAHQSIRAIRTVAPAPVRLLRGPAIGQEVTRVRAALADAIALPPLVGADPAKAHYLPYRQRHLDLQRQMEQRIGPLRESVREALGRASPGLRQLAALDALFEKILAPREQQLLPTAAALLARRFEQLRPPQSREAAGQPDPGGQPALSGPASGWVEIFERDWRQALLAELDLRLEPVNGLIAALGNEKLKKQT